jgi:hypothetical protein
VSNNGAPHACTSCGRACRACAEAAKAGQPLPHTIRAALDVSVELKPYEKLFDRLDRSAGAGVGMETGPVVVDGEVADSSKLGEAGYADFSDGSTP